MSTVTLSCQTALPLLEKEYNRISSIINKRQEAILQIHLNQRNLELSKRSWWQILFGDSPEPITIEQAKAELEHTTYGYDLFEVTIDGKVEHVTYSRSTTYQENIRKLYMQARKLCELGKGVTSSIILDEDDSAFLAWS
jgi:hypothetical protein